MTSCWPKGVSQFANQPVSVLIKEYLLVQQLMSFLTAWCSNLKVKVELKYYLNAAEVVLNYCFAFQVI